MLNVKNLAVNYGPIKALKGVSITAKENEITAIIGANGAGKSTLLNSISGLITKASGDIIYRGKSLNDIPVEERMKMGIAHVLEGRHLFKDQTVHDNLLLGAYFRNKKSERKDSMKRIKEVYEKFPVLYEKKNQISGTLSGGQQQMLIIAVALLSKPKLLLLDEPSLGLAPIIVDEVYKLLHDLQKSGVTIIMSEQMAGLALRIADAGFVIEGGKIVDQGDNEYLKNLLSNGLSSVYLGKSKADKEELVTNEY
ncbi:ABC transporter ATP-binding protein [Halalkalibacter krulwichiae]|uniref:High-affinity branched-chain amino acid transport ATP-binding protein LivF n=1 Tax=Halalkalibacter krulwichiae TaxID=199441 RepID=A0A1X9MAR2_9BACI|nr:ABC transporter ATP-binding protein [Halalkalibacter krulwichiae]ARK29734.1 High-affinity branched-chain amino acid transport ATP-binding protein LivF [Halalkalibacter krulwichiae]